MWLFIQAFEKEANWLGEALGGKFYFQFIITIC